MNGIDFRAIWRVVSAVAAVLLAAALSGCGSAPALADALKAGGVADAASAEVSAEIRYLSESKGTNYLCAAVAGGSADMKTLLGSISSGKPAQKPADKQYSPELRCDCAIIVGAVTLYYDAKANLLVYPEVVKGKEKDTIRYYYFTSDQKLAALVTGLRQGAKRKEDDAVKPFRNLEELKASVDATELAEEGQEIDFEFFSGDTPAYTGTACSVYTSADFAAVPADSCLITAYGKTTAGEQEKLSVIGLEANTYYTKIIVSPPDDALDSVDAGDEAPDAYAIVVKKASLDPAKWLVFVDDNNRVLDVILPEDIEGLDQAGASPGASPGATADPAGTPEPDAID